MKNESTRRRLAMLACVGTLMIKRMVSRKKRTMFLVWKEKTEVARVRERYFQIKAVCDSVRKSKDKESSDVDGGLKKIRRKLQFEKRQHAKLEQEFGEFQHELVALKQKEMELKHGIQENRRTKRDLQVEFKHELQCADTRRSSLVSPPPSPPHLPRQSSSSSSPSTSPSSKFTKTVKMWRRTRCDIVDSKCERIFRKYQLPLRRIFQSASLACSRANEQRITKDRWSTLMSSLRIVPDMIPRRVALEAWSQHSTNDLVLGPSLSYNDFLRSLVAISSIVYYSTKTTMSLKRRKSFLFSSSSSLSSEIMLLNLFVRMNQFRVRFRGIEEKMFRKDHFESSHVKKKRLSDLENKILCAIEDVSTKDGRRIKHDKDKDSLLPEPVSVMPDIMLAGLRHRVYEFHKGKKNYMFWSECKDMMKDHLLDPTMSLRTVQHIFQKHVGEEGGLRFGSFVLFLLDISRVKYPAESKILSFQRVVAKLIGVSLHITDDHVQIGVVKKKKKKKKNTNISFHRNDIPINESNLYDSIVSLRREFDRRFVVDDSTRNPHSSSSFSSRSTIGMKNDSIGLLI